MTLDPHDIEAERAALGCLLQNPSLAARSGVRSVDLDEARGHASILRAILSAGDRVPNPEIPMIATELAQRDRLSSIGAGTLRAGVYLHDLTTVAAFPENLSFYARRIRSSALRRGIKAQATRLAQIADTVEDLDDVLGYAATANVELAELVDSPMDEIETPVSGLSTVTDFVNEPTPPYAWIIPGVLEHSDRVMCVAGEGIGKSVLSRQVALMVAAGRHPFAPKARIPQKRTLLVDLENPPNLVRRYMKGQAFAMVADGLDLGDRAWRWSEPGGIDVRSPAGRRMLERVIEQTRPDLVLIGPLYKMSAGSGDKYETEAQETQQVIDALRSKYGIAWWIEHHAPKGDSSGARPSAPYGSSYWMRWPEFGLVIRRQPDAEENVFELARFRGDRDVRMWPDRLLKLGDAGVPWASDFEDPATLSEVYRVSDEAMAEESVSF